MERQEKVKIILGTVLLFFIINILASLPGRLSTLVFIDVTTGTGIGYFIKMNILWIIAVVLIIFFLYRYLKKLNQGSKLNLFSNEYILLAAGILIIVEGLINFMTVLPIYIDSAQTMLKLKGSAGETYNTVAGRTIIMYISTLILCLLEILCGIYFVKKYKNKSGKSA